MKKLTLILFLFSFLLGYSQNNSNNTKQEVQKKSKTGSVNSENNNPSNPTQANDWNSTRSNKTSKTSRVSNPDGNNNPDPTQANDWNSTRSNKTSKTSRVSNPDGNNNPDPTQANDWNSTRSNKTSKTSRVSNPDGNNNPDPTQANDWNSTRSNKTSKTSSVSNPDGNNNPDSTQAKDKDKDKNGKVRVKYVAKFRQANPNQGKNIAASISSGISTPSSSFSNNAYAKNGNYFELAGVYYFSKFGIGISIGQLSSPTNENFSSSTNAIDLSTTNTTQNWKQFYYGIGPEYKAHFGNFSALFSTKIGLQSVKSINLESNYTNGETPIAILKIKSDKNASLSYFSTGLKFGYNLSSNINLYATANYMAAFSNGITISTSKISDSNQNGIIDAEDLKFATGSATVDYEVSTKTIKPQSTNFGIGLSFEFGNSFSTVKRKRPGRTKYADITLKRSQAKDIVNDGSNTERRGKRKAKKECLKNGGTFWESGDGSYHCMMRLPLSTTAKVGENTNNKLFRSKKRKCFKAGGQWVTNSHGSFCFNPKKQNAKVEVRGWNPKEKNTGKKGYDYYKATNKLDEDSDGDGFLEGLEIVDGTDNDCDDSDRSSLKRMNKAELIDAIAKDANLSKADAKRALETLTSNLSKSLGNGGSIQLVGFKQSISARAARTGRNPQTGATIKIASKKGYDYYKAKADNIKRTNNSQNPQGNGGKIQRNKAELIDAMAKDANLSKADIGKALNTFITIILKELNNGNCVKLIIPVAIREGGAKDKKLLRGIEKSDIRRGMKIAPKAKEQTKLLKDKGIYYGKLKFKPSVIKSNWKGKLSTPKGVVLIIREKSTGKIIARTTVDDSGKFKFNTIALRNDLELSWAFPQQASEPIVDEWGCWVKLPPSPAEPLEPMEECDDSELVLRVGLTSCTNPPCPWKIEGKEIRKNERNVSPNNKILQGYTKESTMIFVRVDKTSLRKSNTKIPKDKSIQKNDKRMSKRTLRSRKRHGDKRYRERTKAQTLRSADKRYRERTKARTLRSADKRYRERTKARTLRSADKRYRERTKARTLRSADKRYRETRIRDEKNNGKSVQITTEGNNKVNPSNNLNTRFLKVKNNQTIQIAKSKFQLTAPLLIKEGQTKLINYNWTVKNKAQNKEDKFTGKTINYNFDVSGTYEIEITPIVNNKNLNSYHITIICN